MIRISKALQYALLNDRGVLGYVIAPGRYLYLTVTLDSELLVKIPLARSALSVRDNTFTVDSSDAQFTVTSEMVTNWWKLQVHVAEWMVESINPIVEYFEPVLSINITDIRMRNPDPPAGSTLRIDSLTFSL